MSQRLLRLLSAVRRRMRFQAALDGGARASVAAAAAALVVVYLWRLGLFGSRGLAIGLAAALGVALAAGLARALRRIPLLRVAKRIDVTHQLHDRVGSALFFSRDRAPTPFMLAAIADAEKQSIDARRAAPLRAPDGLGLATVTLAVAVGVAILQFPSRQAALPPPAPRLAHLAVDAEELLPERRAVEELQRAADESDDPALKEAAAELNKLLEQVQNEELTRKQVFDKLAEIEKKIRPGEEGDFEELKRALKKAGAELSREKLTREAGKALEKEDLQQAKKELEKLAAEAEKLDKDKQPQSEKQREELARSLERAAKQDQQQSQLTKEEKQRQEQQKKLKEEERRLKKELAQKPNDQELQRKLERNQRELKRLEREQQQKAEQQRQLQRLQKEMQKAAEQLRQKLSPQAAEALRKAAQQVGQMENEIRKLGNGQRTQVQIAEIKEVLRRVGKSNGQGQGQQGQEGKDGQQARAGDGQTGKDGKPKDGKGGERLREFNDRAGGGKPNALLLGGDGKGDTRVLLPLGGDGKQPPQQGLGGNGQQPPGDGIGSEHDPNLFGDKTKLDSRRKETRVEGQEAAGPSRSETILGSAEKGFSSRAYKRVYGDYSSVVEEVMSKENVPPGYRFYIKRYFQLIKPRE